MKLFTKAIDEMLFKQYPLGSDLSSQMVVAKIFNPYGRGTWYLLNSDPQDSDYIWAIVDLFDVEMGSVSRSELEGLKVPPFRLGLERDTFFTPINALTLYEGLMEGKMYADGGSLEDMRKQMEKRNIDVRTKIVQLIGIDETLESLQKDYVISPFRLLDNAIARGFITTDDITSDLWFSALEEAEEIDERYRDSGDGIGSSDMGYFVRSMLNNGGIEVKMADGGETEVQQYKSYDEFVKKNIGKGEIVITVGSGGVSQPIDGATKESIDSQFKNLIFHNYLDSEFYYNRSSDDVKKEYKELVNDYYEVLIKSPKDFSDFWEKNMQKSGRYGSLYQIKNTNYIDNKLVETRYQNGKKKYVIEKSRDNYVDVDKPKEYTDLLLVTYKDKASKKLKDEYKKYKKEYAGEDIVEFADGGETEVPYLTSLKSKLEHAKKYNTKKVPYYEEKIKEWTSKKENKPKMAMGGEISDNFYKTIGAKSKNDFFDTIYGNRQLYDKVERKLNVDEMNKLINYKEPLFSDTMSVLFSLYYSKDENHTQIKGGKTRKAFFEDAIETLYGKMAMGGETTFDDKVKAVKSSLLKRKKVSPKVQKDYGKTYSPKEAEESAKRIVGSRVAKWNEKMVKK